MRRAATVAKVWLRGNNCNAPRKTSLCLLGLPVLVVLGCGPPRDPTREPGVAVAVSRERALEIGRAALASRCWGEPEWKVVWWPQKSAWSVTCAMEDADAQARCHTLVDGQTGATKPDRLCIGNHQDL